jgi:uncharacterized protein DUF2510
MSAATPAGWYPDPHGQAELRYWDGNDWTEHTHNSQAQGAPPAQAPPPAQQPPPQAAPPQTAPQYTPSAGYGGGAGRGGGRSTMPFIIGGIIAAVVVIAVVVLLVAGGGGGNDTDAVKKNVEAALTSQDPDTCDSKLTQDYVEQSTGLRGEAAVNACKDGLRKAPFATSADISDASSSDAKARVTGGSFSGQTVEVAVNDKKVDGITANGQQVTILGGPDPVQAKPVVEKVVTDFGSSVGSSACDYLSEKKLGELGGRSGCESQFRTAVAADYNVESSSVTGRTAKVTVTTSGDTIDFDLVYEKGEWKIEDFNKRT